MHICSITFYAGLSSTTSEISKGIQSITVEPNNTSSDESDITEDEEAENEDVVRFILGNSSSINGSKKSPKDRSNGSSTGGSSIGVQQIFQSLGLSPTIFLETHRQSPKNNKVAEKVTNWDSNIPADVIEELGNNIGGSRGPPTSKIRLTYGMESKDGRSTHDVNIPVTHISSSSSNTIRKSSVKDQDNVKLNTKETYSKEKEQLSASENSNQGPFSSQVQLSGDNKIRISAPSFGRTKESSSLLSVPSRKMDKSSTSTNVGTAGSGSQGGTIGEKRPLSAMSSTPQDHNIDENEDESKKKKPKTSSASNASSSAGVSAGVSAKEEGSIGKESLPTSASSSVSSVGGTAGTGSTLGKGGRSTRGNSSEKNPGIV